MHIVSEELKNIYEDTVAQLDKTPTKSETKLYSYNHLPFTVNIGNYDTQIVSVIPKDTISCALDFRGNGKTAILNMASNRRAGGGVINGAKAQEECLFRCTDLYKTMTMDFYPLKLAHGLYTTDTLIFKDARYNILEEPMYVDTISVPAINLNKLSMERDVYEIITEDKINFIYNLAAAHHVDNLILGSWGCGVYKNDPDFISKLFLKVLQEKGYKFKKVVFGVINDHNSVGNNYEIFKKNIDVSIPQ
jgi:uncharacterized protein (TIGR02452 family)